AAPAAIAPEQGPDPERPPAPPGPCGDRPPTERAVAATDHTRWRLRGRPPEARRRPSWAERTKSPRPGLGQDGPAASPYRPKAPPSLREGPESPTRSRAASRPLPGRTNRFGRRPTLARSPRGCARAMSALGQGPSRIGRETELCH